MSSMEKEAWQRVEASIYAETPEKSKEAYTAWATKYDSDLVTLDAVGPTLMAKLTMSHVKDSESTIILDVAAGTGLVGEQLRKCGFKGIMDAVDINESMLKQAEPKNLYRKLICAGVTPGENIPVSQSSYDCVISAGSFAKFHIEAESLVPMVQCVKPGGLLLFNTRKNKVSKEFKATVDKKLNDMVLSGQIEEIENKVMAHYGANKDLDQYDDEEKNPMFANYYVYKKL